MNAAQLIIWGVLLVMGLALLGWTSYTKRYDYLKAYGTGWFLGAAMGVCLSVLVQ